MSEDLKSRVGLLCKVHSVHGQVDLDPHGGPEGEREGSVRGDVPPKLLVHTPPGTLPG